MRRSLLVITLGASACGGELDRPMIDRTDRALEAYCTAEVRGTGSVDVENDYVAHVVACENGSADDEALRAQAVAARTYLYFKMETSRSIGDGQSDQVYSCSRAPDERHVRAAQSTAGEVLTFEGTILASFYVAGAIPTTSDCVPAAGDRDPHDTEQWVTYNWMKRGSEVTQSPLGWVDPANDRNRGCKSQNGANCLSRAGWGYRDILHFYYGMDVTLERASGACVGEPPPPVVIEEPCLVASDTIVEESSACFSSTCALSEVGSGSADRQLTMASAIDPTCEGRWLLEVEEAGEYSISVWVGGARADGVVYRVMHAGVEDAVLVDQSKSDAWAPLGTYRFEVGAEQWIELGDAALRANETIVFDAVRLRKVVAEVPVGPPAVPPPAPEPMYGEEPVRTGPTVAESGGCTCVAAARAGSSGLALLPLMWVLLRRRGSPP